MRGLRFRGHKEDPQVLDQGEGDSMFLMQVLVGLSWTLRTMASRKDCGVQDLGFSMKGLVGLGFRDKDIEFRV